MAGISEDASADWATQSLRLNQALLGAISPNFRRVKLGRENNVWQLIFIIENDDAEDREEIEDVVTQFDALQETNMSRNVVVVVTDGKLDAKAPDGSEVILYWRREAN